jgi:hypothetical protein
MKKKSVPLEDLLVKYYGKKGTKSRDKFEAELKVEIKKAKKK